MRADFFPDTFDGSAEAVFTVGSVVVGGGSVETGTVLNEKLTFTVPPARRGLPQEVVALRA
jgi:hypothetical protein